MVKGTDTRTGGVKSHSIKPNLRLPSIKPSKRISRQGWVAN